MTTVGRGPADLPVDRPVMNTVPASYRAPVPRRPRTSMRLCSICRLPILGGDDDVCWYHERDTTVGWADVNRAFCDWLHRGVGRR